MPDILVLLIQKPQIAELFKTSAIVPVSQCQLAVQQANGNLRQRPPFPHNRQLESSGNCQIPAEDRRWIVCRAVVKEAT